MSNGRPPNNAFHLSARLAFGAETSTRRTVVMLAVSRLATIVVLLALAVPADAQQPGKTYRVAYLAAAPRSGNQAQLSGFQQGMRELGYVEGQNLALETRFADGKFERLPMLAHELVRLNPDVLFVSTTPGSLAAQATTTTAGRIRSSSSDGRLPSSTLQRPGARDARLPAADRSVSRTSGDDVGRLE